MKQKTLTDNILDLPKWAQSEIKILQMRLKESKDELYRIRENPESNTIAGTHYTFPDEQKQYLKNDQMVSFILEKGAIQARIENGYLGIHSSGEGELNIRPHVSNGIKLYLK